MAKLCENCRFCADVAAETAHCRRYPPKVAAADGSSSFPLVKAASWSCGEYRRHLRRWIASLLK